ncbi:hypothetical protein BDY19DRAFT_970643 [Irpex rosettiformis]|uniref:Uncharacterized protein n=1 Tax=Irpex rosettiformis TaxID=378272 RepID=A0ACB8TRR4_9APHY|nr:hypothetical protein BDY19DRAFT_970643 [Irpex rosettiformis]
MSSTNLNTDSSNATPSTSASRILRHTNTTAGSNLRTRYAVGQPTPSNASQTQNQPQANLNADAATGGSVVIRVVAPDSDGGSNQRYTE